MNDLDLRMACALADELPSTGTGFVGVGSSGRAHTLVTVLPMAGAFLARRRGSDFDIQVGPLIGVDLDRPPATSTDRDVYSWSATAFLRSEENFANFQGGRVEVGFSSGAQIDRYGNVNVNQVSGRSGTVKLGGSLAVPEILNFAGKVILLADLSPRVFVEQVDFVSGFGHRYENVTRQQLGLAGRGPQVVVTDHGVFRFRDGRMILESWFPHTDPAAIQELVPFDLEVTRAEVRAEPTETDLAYLSEFRPPAAPV